MNFKTIFLFITSFLIGIVIFALVYDVVGWQKLGNVLAIFSFDKGLVIFFLTLLMLLIGTLRWQTILLSGGVKASFFNLFEMYSAGYSILFLAPVLFFGGELFRAYVLKKKNILSFSKSMASVIIERVLEWTFNLIFIICGLFVFILNVDLITNGNSFVFSILFFLLLSGLVFFYLKVFRRESVAKFLEKHFNGRLNGTAEETEKEIFLFFNIKNSAMWKAFSLSFIRMVLMFSRNFLLLVFLNQHINIGSVLSILSFNLLATMIPIPASLGSHEAFQIFAFNSLGFNSITAMAFTLIIRSAEFLLSLIGLIFLFKLIIELFNKRLDELLKIKND